MKLGICDGLFILVYLMTTSKEDYLTGEIKYPSGCIEFKNAFHTALFLTISVSLLWRNRFKKLSLN
jgi:hypothetical protein